jgi:hypothetical protein
MNIIPTPLSHRKETPKPFNIPVRKEEKKEEGGRRAHYAFFWAFLCCEI